MIKKQKIYVLHATGFDNDGTETSYYHDRGDLIYGRRSKADALANMKAYRQMGISSTLSLIEVDFSKAKLLRSVKGRTKAQQKKIRAEAEAK